MTTGLPKDATPHFELSTPSTGTVLIAGSLNVDFSVRVPHLPLPGETVLGSAYQITPGGKGANQAVACARHGATVRFLGATGLDAHAEVLHAALRDNGIDITLLKQVDTPTGAAFISVSDTGENVIVVAEGANAHLRPEHTPSFLDVTYFVMPLETPMPTVEAFAHAAHAAGVPFVLNAAPAQPLDDTLLAAVHILIVNEGELAAIQASTTQAPLPLARALLARGPEIVIVTLGSRGCIAVTRDGKELHVPAFNVDVVDTTGAGDTFTGTLVAQLAAGTPLADALQTANAAAALACTKPGAQASMPTRDEVEHFLHQHPTAMAMVPR